MKTGPTDWTTCNLFQGIAFGFSMARLSRRRPRGGTVESISILLVEDEALISTMVEDALAGAGFIVTVVAKGEEAIHMLEDHAADYRALVTDVNLSNHVTGWEVAKRAREITPEMPVVYTSGGGAAEWTSKGVPNSILIEKPFAAAQVVTAVSQLLNQGNTPAA
jgi:DNA-binding response OmpR family regulator